MFLRSPVHTASSMAIDILSRKVEWYLFRPCINVTAKYFSVIRQLITIFLLKWLFNLVSVKGSTRYNYVTLWSILLKRINEFVIGAYINSYNVKYCSSSNCLLVEKEFPNGNLKDRKNRELFEGNGPHWILMLFYWQSGTREKTHFPTFHFKCISSAYSCVHGFIHKWR